MIACHLKCAGGTSEHNGTVGESVYNVSEEVWQIMAHVILCCTLKLITKSAFKWNILQLVEIIS